MNGLAAAAIAAGELVCEFSDGYRKSLVAALVGDPPRTERILLYGDIGANGGYVLDTGQAGRKPVHVRSDAARLHLIQPEGPSLRVTTLTGCTRTSLATGLCTRFSARHAWHFDRRMLSDPAASMASQPSGSASGTCEPWRVE